MLISFIYIFFFFFFNHCCKILFLWSLFRQNLWLFHPFLYMIKKKSKFFFIVIWVHVQWLHVFALRLLVNDPKNIYSHYVCIMVFHTSCLYNGFYKNCLYNGFSYELLVSDGFSHELLVCDGFLYIFFSFKIIFSIKRGYVYV